MALAQALANERVAAHEPRDRGGIGEMDQGYRRRKSEQRFAIENHAQCARAFSILVAAIVVVQATRQRMINLARTDASTACALAAPSNAMSHSAAAGAIR